MTTRLVAAQVWRIRWFLLMLMSSAAAGASQSTGFGNRLNMAIPLFLAAPAMSMIGVFWSRDVRVLPIARCVALRSAWLSALVLPCAIVAGRIVGTGVQVALGSTSTAGIEVIALRAVWDTTFIGVTLTLMQRPDYDWAGLRHAFSNLRESGVFLVTLLWLVVPLAGPELVPRSLDDVTWVHLIGVLVGTVVTAWPLMTAPDQWPILGVYDSARETVVKPVRMERPNRPLDRLVGMRRLLPGPAGVAALVATLALATSVVIGIVRGALHSPFAADMNNMEFFLIGGPFFLLFFGPFTMMLAGTGLAPSLTPFLRRLRALPVSTMQLAVTMTMMPLMMPVFFWLLAYGVHLLIGVAGDSHWRLGSVALLCGVMAVITAVHARVNSPFVMLPMQLLPLIGVFAAMEFFEKDAVGPMIDFWFPLVGLIGVPLAFLLNYRTVTRGSSSAPAYRPAPGESLYRGGA
jgi:hypothetical protein